MKSKYLKAESEGMINTKLKFHTSDDDLHEGRTFGNRRIGMWSTFNSANKVCSEAAKEIVSEDCLSHWGEKL